MKKVRCIFVHGWAMNSAVWDKVADQLPDWIDAVFVDLPGHGTMSEVPFENIDSVIETLVPLTHQPAVWVGWSMGAQILMRLYELYPERVASLFFVSASPCFVTREDWSSAVNESVFVQFAQSLSDNQDKTLLRFLSLQVKGQEDARSVVRELRAAMSVRGPASQQALNNGLEILLKSDFRQLFESENIPQSIPCPVSWFLGGRDTLVPKTLAVNLQSLYPCHTFFYEKLSGHLPFVTDTEQFVEALLTQVKIFRT